MLLLASLPRDVGGPKTVLKAPHCPPRRTRSLTRCMPERPVRFTTCSATTLRLFNCTFRACKHLYTSFEEQRTRSNRQ